MATRPHGSLTGAGESHASLLASSRYQGFPQPVVARPGDRRPHPSKRSAACCRVANRASLLANPSPTPADPPEGFTSAETERARIHVEPGAETDADAFARSWGYSSTTV